MVSAKDNSNSIDAVAKAWAIFEYNSYVKIVARKHGITPPDISTEFEDLTVSEIERRVRLLQDLAHLPPQ